MVCQHYWYVGVAVQMAVPGTGRGDGRHILRFCAGGIMPSGLGPATVLVDPHCAPAQARIGAFAMTSQLVDHELVLARRMTRLGTETAFEVLSKAKALERQGKSIVHLEIGEPDFDTPKHIVEAAVDALREGWTHYSPSAGLPELREAIADSVSRTRGVTVSPEEVVVVPGGKPILFYALLALVDEGDEVIYPNPGFPIYESMIRYAGGTAVPIPLREERDFAMDVDEMARLITPSTKLIILNSPQNPTGGVLARGDIERAAAAIGDRNIMVLSDEIYSRLQFEGEPFSMMSVPGMEQRTILLDGFSKTYAMTGWRIGYGVMREDLDGPNNAPDDQLQLVHRELYAARGAGGACRRPERRGRHARGVRAAQPRLCRRPQPHQGVQRAHAQGRVLRLRQHYRHRLGVEAARRCAAGRGGRGGAFRHGVWRLR